MTRSFLMTLVSTWGVAMVMGVTTAQDLPRRPRPFPEQIVPAEKGFRVTDRVLFVIDVSGSMDNPKRREAVDSVLMIAGSDQFRVGAIAFTSSYSRWSGAPHCHPGQHRPPRTKGSVQAMPSTSMSLIATPCGRRCVPPNWAGLPQDLDKFSNWLTSLKPSGSTNPTGALKAALEDPTPNLTIVFVSDGVFDPRVDAVKAIEEGLAWRKKHKLNRARIMVWGAGSTARTQDDLKKIARIGGGGFWVHGKKRAGPF